MKLKNMGPVLFFCFLLIPFFEPTYVSYNLNMIHKIYICWQIINALIALIVYLKNNKLSKWLFLLIMYELIIILTTFINNAEISVAITDAIKLIAICSIIEYGLKTDAKSIVIALLIILLSLITLNLITILVYPEGMYKNEISTMRNNWLLGNDNVHIRFFLPTIIISIIYYYIIGKNKKTITVFTILICTISVFIRFSATTVVGYVLFIAYLLFFKFLKNNKIFNFKTYSIIYIILFISIVVIRVQNIFSYIIVDLLGKDLTFTGRTYIWDEVIYYIKQKMIMGYGIEAQTIRSIKNGFTAAVHSHDIILEIFYIGGIMLFTAFLIIIIYSLCKKKFYNNPIYKIISFGVFVFFIMMLTEVYNLTTIFILLIFAQNIDLLVKERGRYLDEKNKEQYY